MSPKKPSQPTIQNVKKRDGRLDEFNQGKIYLAIERCFKNGIGSSDEESAISASKVTKAVVNIFSKKTESPYDVEDIQKVIIQQLWARGYDEAAEQYTLFKEKRRQERLESPVDPELRKMVENDGKYFPSAIQYYQFISKFAKWSEELGRRETWGECTDRVINFFAKHDFYGKLSEKDKKDLKEYLNKMEATPAMRVIQMAGPALDRCHVGVYNCSYLTISDIKSFSELLYILMQGTGAGFSVERQYVDQLPPVRRQTGKTPKKLVIIDDTEGWCDALTAGIEAWFNGEDIEFDYSKIRPSGTRLKTKGGRASGPGPLMELMSFARNLILSRQGQSLTEIDCHDLACKVGKIVQVGGVRRASEISLSDLGSMEMRNAKAGSWWTNNLQRTMANNSAVYTKKPSTIEFMEEWLALAKSGSGERGIFNREGVNKALPKRRKPWTFGTNPCVPADTWVHTGEGPKQVKDLIGKPFMAMVDGKEFECPTGFVMTGVKQLYKISMEDGGSFRATDNHKVLVATPGSRQKTKWVEVKDLKDGDKVVRHNHRKSTFKGKGSFYNGKEVGELVGDIATKSYKIPEFSLTYGGVDYNPYTYEVTDGFLGARHLLAHDYGIICNLSKNITPEIEATSYEFHKGFIRGLFDKAGKVDCNGGTGIHLTGMDHRDLSGVQRMLARLGIASSIKYNHKAANKPGSMGHDNKYRLVISKDNIVVYASSVGSGCYKQDNKINSLIVTSDRVTSKEYFRSRVMSVVKEAVEPVYDCTVPGPSAFDANGFYLHNCAEIILRPYQFCNLSIVVARENDTPDSLADKVRIATIFGTMQSCLTNFKYIRKEWISNCEEERLLGVDITGQMDCPILRPGAKGRTELLERLKAIVSKTNEEYAKKFGIPRSAANTCVKPSGDSAVMFGCSSGIHARFAQYYIRRVRERADSPIAAMLIDAGVPWIVAPEDASLIALEFPCASPKGAIIKTQQTAIDQLDNWLDWKRHWAEHSVSATVYMEQDEWLDAGQWVYKNFDEISGISFLPRDNGTYTGTPYEEIDEAEYKRRVETFPQIDWAKLSRYEKTDHTESSQTYACTSGNCEL